MRRKSIKQKDKLKILVGLVVLYSAYILIQFIRRFFSDPNNVRALLIVLLVLGVVVIGLIIWKVKLYSKKKKLYESSAYFKQTQTRFHALKKQKGAYFEYSVTHKLETELPDAYLVIDTVFERKDSINEHVEVDCIILDKTGIYVVELKDYKGYVYGKRSDKQWNVGYTTNNHKKVYTMQNPIMQNAQHIKDLQAYINKPMQNVVIFSDESMNINQLPELYTLEGLLSQIRSAKPLYGQKERDELKAIITRLTVREARDNHIKRIDYNTAKVMRIREGRKQA